MAWRETMWRTIVTAIFQLIFLMLLQLPAQATILLTMDDLPTQAVNGLMHPSGVKFGFTVGGIASSDAQYASGGPMTTAFINDPSVEGNAAGVLDITFPAIFNVVQFGVAVSTMSPSSVNVELFNASNTSLGVSSLPLTLHGFQFIENRFTYGGIGVSRLRLDLTPSSTSPRFAFDNLFLDSSSTPTIPEPTSLTMFALGTCLLSTFSRSRRSS